MKKQAQVFILLVIGLFIVVNAADTALARYAHSANENSFTLYDENGQTLVAYQGDLSNCPAYVKPVLPSSAPIVLHRT